MPEKNQKKAKKPGQLHNRPVQKEYKYTPAKPMKYIDPKTGKDTDKRPAGLQMNYSPTQMGHSPAEMSPYKMGHSPAEMGHSPAQNHHYGKRKGESVKQETKDLMKDNPVARTAAGQRPWISKHFKSSLNMNHSPAEMGHSPAEMGHSPAEMGHSPAEKKYDSGLEKHCM